MADTAKETVHNVFAQHSVKSEPLDTRTTDGIQRTLAAHTEAIHALARHIDGDNKPDDDAQPVAEYDPRPVEQPVIRDRPRVPA